MRSLDGKGIAARDEGGSPAPSPGTKGDGRVTNGATLISNECHRNKWNERSSVIFTGTFGGKGVLVNRTDKTMQGST